MLGVLNVLLGFGSRFRPVPGPVRAHVSVRAYRSSDEEACREIYRLNEPGRFPPNYESDFTNMLRRNDYLKLVAVENAAVVGVGGITLIRFYRQAILAFGMVRPEWHRRGVGTALLMLRAAALPEPSPRWALTLSPLPGSRSFYERFGFAKFGQFRGKSDGPLFDCHYAHLRREAWTQCRGETTHFCDAATPLPPVPDLDARNNDT